MGELIEEVAARAAVDPIGVIAEMTWLGEAIDSDALAGRLDQWGWSTVIDEHVGGAVISKGLFGALHARADLPAQWPVGNAGLLHVYGYLLSTVPTPFGFKRDRWLGGALAGAYGLPADAFVPWSSPRSLLDRATEAINGLRRAATVREAVVGGFTTSLALDRHFEQGPWALAYVVDGRLVTTFPVESRENVLAEWDAEAPRLRWNAVEPPG